MRIRSPLAAVAVLAALASCTAPDSSPTALHPTAPAFAGGKASPPPTATFVLANDGAYLLRGDGVSLEPDGSSRYANGDCAVSTVIYALAGGSGDATLGMGHGKCTRNVRITYASINADGSTTSEGSLTTDSFLNVRKLEVAASGSTPASAIPVGATETRTFAFSDGGAKCGTGGTAAIVFAPLNTDGTPTNADLVQVHREATDSWTVSTLPDEVDVDLHVVHHDKAFCRGNGKLYHMPLHFTIKSSVPLTP